MPALVFPAPGSPSGQRFVNSFTGINILSSNISRLEPYDNQGVYVGPAVGVSGTDNIKPFDTVGDYINDYTFTASTYVFPYPGYLYFNPAQDSSLQRIQFPLGSYVKLSNTFTGYSEVTMVLESNLNNIFVTLAPEFPNNYLGGTTIQDASPFYYPKEKVVQDSGQISLPITNVELPRTNLLYSQYRPLIPGRSIVYNTDRILGDAAISVPRTINRLETFQNSVSPGDFLLPVTGQNTEVRYGVVSWYTNESDVLAKTSATSVVKTIYFPIQGSTVYASSSTIRIKNVSINYDKTFSVITGTNYSVTILDPDDFPAGSVTTIEKAESSVYQQQYVKPTTNPTNARENLYYFNLAQGYRSNSTFMQGIAFASPRSDIVIPKLSNATKLKTNPTRLTVDKLSAAIQVKGIPAVVSSSTFVNRIQSITSQTSVRTLLRPVTPAERLFYFNMAPGYLNNRTYSYGNTLATDNTIVRSANLSKQIQSLRSDRTAVPTVGKLRAASKVVGDTIRLQIGKTFSVSIVKGDRVAPLYAGVIQPVKFRFDTNQLFFAPQSGNLAKQIAKLTAGFEPVTFTAGNLAKQIAKLTAGYEGLSVELLVKPIQVLKEDRVVISVGNTRSVSLLKSINSIISTNSIENPIKFAASTTEVFFAPSFGKVSSAIIVKDTNVYGQQGTLKFAIKVNDTPAFISTGLINNPILRLSDIDNLFQFGAIENPIKFAASTTEVFFVPSFGKVSSAAKLADIIGTTTVAQLSKQLSIIKDTNINVSTTVAQLSKQIAVIKDTISNVQQGNLKFAFTVKDQSYNITSGNIQQNIRFLNNQLFFVPSFGKTNSVSIIKADGNRLDVAKLSVTNKFKAVPQQLDPGAITKFKFSVLYSQVFYAPQFGKTNSVSIIKADGNRLVIGKVNSSARLASPNNIYYDTGITDNYFDQTNYAAITVPNSPAAWYRYFNIAPGFRASLTYQQGKSFAPDYTTIKSDRLSTFDNEGLVTDPYLDITGSTDPIVAVTGRTSQFTTDVVLWYIDDKDVLTLLPAGSPTLTLYFRIMSWTTTPFAAGQRVKITSNTINYSRYATVLSADASSITIVEPDDFPSISDMTIQHVEHTNSVTVYFTPQLNQIPYPTGSYVRITNNANASYITVLVEDSGLNYVTFTKPNLEFALPAYDSATIASASIVVYPKNRVSTQVAPTRPRENLYYAELARGYRYGVINTPFGSSIAQPSFDLNTQFLGFNKLKIKGITSFLNSSLIEKDSLKLRSPISNKLAPEFIFKFTFEANTVQVLNFDTTVSQLERNSIKLRGLIDVPSLGQLRKQLFQLLQPGRHTHLIEFLYRFKVDKNQISEIQLGVNKGIITTFKTGDYKPGSTGIVDVAAPKKEPIQFWN